MRLAFFHGWGFDAAIWQDLLRHLPLKKAECFDQGFFGPSYLPAWEDDEHYVLVAHSMGILHALENPPKNIRALVLINGFAKFLRGDRKSPGVDPAALQMMQDKFRQQPLAVLADFHNHIGSPFMAHMPPGAIRPDRLDQALDWLRDKDVGPKLQALSCPILALAAHDDPLIGESHTQALMGDSPGIQLQYLDQGGHILPISRAEWCARQIQNILS